MSIFLFTVAYRVKIQEQVYEGKHAHLWAVSRLSSVNNSAVVNFNRLIGAEAEVEST